MVNPMETTSFLLRQVPKDFWGCVKAEAYKRNMTIRDWILEVMRVELKRQGHGKEADRLS